MLPKHRTFHFGSFSFSRAHGLRQGEVPVTLRHLERQLLKCLLERPGEIVRKEELISALWPTTSVSPNTLNVLIRRLRVRLRDTSGPPRIIESVSRMGFRVRAQPAPKRVMPVADVLLRGDHSRFIRDVTIPDGSILAPGEHFEKVWEIQNVGRTTWKHRQLRRVGACEGPGRLTSPPTIEIALTPPGRLCLVRVALVAPFEPGSYYAAWKMTDRTGGELLPTQSPLFISVDVVLDRR